MVGTGELRGVAAAGEGEGEPQPLNMLISDQ